MVPGSRLSPLKTTVMIENFTGLDNSDKAAVEIFE